jgi:hypothetical protein
LPENPCGADGYFQDRPASAITGITKEHAPTNIRQNSEKGKPGFERDSWAASLALKKFSGRAMLQSEQSPPAPIWRHGFTDKSLRAFQV